MVFDANFGANLTQNIDKFDVSVTKITYVCIPIDKTRAHCLGIKRCMCRFGALRSA
jgi:hypothetical protein